MKKKVLCTICVLTLILTLSVIVIYVIRPTIKNRIATCVEQAFSEVLRDHPELADELEQVNREDLEEIQLHQYDIERAVFLQHKSHFLTVANLLLTYRSNHQLTGEKTFYVDMYTGKPILYVDSDAGSEPLLLTAEEQESLKAVVQVYDCGACLDVIRVPDLNTVYFDMATGEHALVYSADGSSDLEPRVKDRGEYIN